MSEKDVKSRATNSRVPNSSNARDEKSGLKYPKSTKDAQKMHKDEDTKTPYGAPS